MLLSGNPIYSSIDWRDVPLLEAISFGVASVEADVNLFNGTLYVSECICNDSQMA